MAEEQKPADVKGEQTTFDEQARKFLRKQKLMAKFAPLEARTLTDDDIKVLMSQARVPMSRLLGPGGGWFPGGGWRQADRDPTDSVISGDNDLDDAIRVTDADVNDPYGRTLP